MHTIERFVILLYDRTSTCKDIDKDRKKLFAKKNNVWGWVKNDEGVYEPHRMKLPEAAHTCYELVSCKCKKSCLKPHLSLHTQRHQQELDDLWNHAPIIITISTTQVLPASGLEWDCDRCHTEHDCQHKISLTKAPPVLVLHLNSFSICLPSLPVWICLTPCCPLSGSYRSSASPNSEHKLRVRYPLDLVVDVNSAGSSKRYYSLFAVCCHNGNMYNGHYTALCRTGEQWYHFNDTQVSPIALEDVLHKPAAHILFYEAKE
ncbi:Ubiquitin carboxyl-terminal hydrolase 21 [Chionoecetes opilio]|uniref:ubiquitinyl hydrolase 1 n=1 Tax=Chionoecetes opilio TaxID=41210 RepID=A0A8J4YLG4_CHIOP|nr:Ubiquitin carboxyl-terminal hydrolase 21 [Chionoecetes opilio]